MQSYQNSQHQAALTAAAARRGEEDNVYPSPNKNQRVITILNENDVLLGRGKETINYIGNIRFRAMIEAKKAAYVGNKSKNGKDLIARQVRAEVENSGGRFLQKMTKGDRNGAWVAQSVDVAVLKIKQAFQYQLYQKEQKLQQQREEMERRRSLVQSDSRICAAYSSSAQREADGWRPEASLKTSREGLSIVNRTSSPTHRLPSSTKSSATTWRPVTATGQLTNSVPPASESSRVQFPVFAQMRCSSTTNSIAKSNIKKCSSFARQEQIQDEEKPRDAPTKCVPRCEAPASATKFSTASAAAEKIELESGSDSSVTQSVHSPDGTNSECATRARPEDVLLGRGEDVSRQAGNIHFQKLVMDRKREYLAAAANDRERLAREIKNDVHARRGRFLKRVEGHHGLWVPIGSKAAMKKIKQSFLYTYNTDASPRDVTYYQSIAVKEFTKNDVLLGRGRRTINNVGNIRFRELISSRKPEYTATSLHSGKDRIARDIKKIIEDRNGRFLEKLEGTEDAWVPVDEAVILKKIKLCFRYNHSETLGEQGLVPGPTLDTRASNASLFEAAKKLAGINRPEDRCSEVGMPAKVSDALSSEGHAYQQNNRDALLPPVLASAFVDSVVMPIHTADIRPDDVLLGRGKETLQYIGNVRFRQLVEQMKGMYVAIPSREEKDRVARTVKAIVESRNGRFLKRFENSQQKGIVTWLPVDDSVALLKIKTAFQYVLYQKELQDGDGSNDQNGELSEASSKSAELNVQLGPNTVPIGLSVTSFGDERRIQELMASMKQQLAPCQEQLGGADKVQALVEKSIRNLQGAVSQAFSRGNGQPQLREMSCIKEMTMAIAKSRAEADIDESLAGVPIDRKPAARVSDGKVDASKNDFFTEFAADSSDAHRFPAHGDYPESFLRASNGLREVTSSSDPRSEEELRRQLMLQVSRLSTDELLNLATLARSAAMAPPWLTGNRTLDQLRSSSMLIGETSARSSRNDTTAGLDFLLESGAALETGQRKRSIDDLTGKSHAYGDNDNYAKKRERYE